MLTRKIGSDDVSAIGFGAMGISAFYGQTEPDEERFKVKCLADVIYLVANCPFQVLDRAYQLGCTFWDTANIYGDSEELIGKWYVVPSCVSSKVSHMSAGSSGTPRSEAKSSLPPSLRSFCPTGQRRLTDPLKMSATRLPNRRNCLGLIRLISSTCTGPSIILETILLQTYPHTDLIPKYQSKYVA